MSETSLEKMWEALGECWTQEFGELELTVNHTLTEPTCPMAVIATESDDGPSWRADQDTIEQAIYTATVAAYMTIVERKPKPMTCPVTDANEDRRVADFLAALDRRRAA
jgi:hypothetical protein